MVIIFTASHYRSSTAPAMATYPTRLLAPMGVGLAGAAPTAEAVATLETLE